MNCSNSISGLPSIDPDTGRVDKFTFSNLSESGILPGSTCVVRGCYVNEVPRQSLLYVLTPLKNCTILGEIIIL